MLDETPAATVEEVPGSPEKPQYGNIRVEDLDTPEYSEEQMQEFTAMYDESFSGKNEGEIVQGRVVGIHPQEVLVDIGFKSEGAISIREFSDPEAIAIGKRGGGLPSRTSKTSRAASCSRSRRRTSCASGTRSRTPTTQARR